MRVLGTVVRISKASPNASFANQFASNTTKSTPSRSLGVEQPTNDIIDRRSGTITFTDAFERNRGPTARDSFQFRKNNEAVTIDEASRAKSSSSGRFTATDDLWQFGGGPRPDQLASTGDDAQLANVHIQKRDFDQKNNQLMHGLISAHLSRI